MNLLKDSAALGTMELRRGLDDKEYNQQRAQKEEFHFTPIEEGLRETIQWFVANYENVRN